MTRCTDFDAAITALRQAIEVIGKVAPIVLETLESAMGELETIRDENHDWQWVVNWEGDPSIPNGTNDLSHWECRHCQATGFAPAGCRADRSDVRVAG